MVRQDVVARLAEAGCVAADREADELLHAADTQRRDIADLLDRRVTGEPLAWVTGVTTFCDQVIRVHPGVYVPRPHTEALARRAIAALPPNGIAVDVCTGSGAIAAVLAANRPGARILATDIDPAAVACARANGVTALTGELDTPLPAHLRGRVDVITAVAPYVPAEALHLLPRDVQAFEPRHALDGGPGGSRYLGSLITRSAQHWLRPGGALLLEVGGDQAAPMASLMQASDLEVIEIIRDDDGDERGIVGRRLRGRASRPGECRPGR
ncbi:MAG: peptide chain release factor N(5)-glutamine methyltransferase [Acidimicrobiia bacterium]|nr:peptide chain release factor N(5)-glutamine methyltransferase [Acidimicrobiia bacterium]